MIKGLPVSACNVFISTSILDTRSVRPSTLDSQFYSYRMLYFFILTQHWTIFFPRSYRTVPNVKIRHPT